MTILSKYDERNQMDMGDDKDPDERDDIEKNLWGNSAYLYIIIETGKFWFAENIYNDEKESYGKIQCIWLMMKNIMKNII